MHYNCNHSYIDISVPNGGVVVVDVVKTRVVLMLCLPNARQHSLRLTVGASRGKSVKLSTMNTSSGTLAMSSRVDLEMRRVIPTARTQMP